MKTIEHTHGIYEIENFLTEEQQKALLSFCTEDSWFNENPYNIAKQIPIEYHDEADKIREKCLSLFKNGSSKQIRTIRKIIKGGFMPDHIDSGDIENSEPIVFGLTMYLNNDFTGGELYYTQFGLKITPRPRNLVIHHARHRHLVLPVESGNRYAISTFILGDKDTAFIKPNN